MEKMMLKIKKDILENAGSNDTNGSSNDGGTIGTKSNNDVYFYGIGGGLLTIAIGFLIYYKFNPQKKSVEVNTKVEEPLVYRGML